MFWYVFKVLRRLSHIEQLLGDLMAQVDDLNAKLDEVSSKVDAVGVEVVDLIAMLSAVPPPTDLGPSIAKAQGIADKLAAIPPEPVK